MDILSSPWTYTPHHSSIGTHRWFAIGDVHGQDTAFEKALTSLKTLTTEPFSLVLLGDLIDRGPNSLRCLTLAENAKTLSGAQEVVTLPGNHELMMLDVAHKRDEARIWLDNGGFETLESMEPHTGPLTSYTQMAEGLRAILPAYWLDETFPTHLIVEDFLFVHAGVSPLKDLNSFLAKPPQKSRLQAVDDEHWAWIRWSFLQHPGGWPDSPKLTVVHGHTPAFRRPITSPMEFEECLFPDGHRRVCLDGGAAIMPQLLIGEFFEDSVRVHALRETPGWLP